VDVNHVIARFADSTAHSTVARVSPDRLKPDTPSSPNFNRAVVHAEKFDSVPSRAQ